MNIKVCGITDYSQAIEISRFVDYIGFIFYPPSPRHTENSFPSVSARKTGVFVNLPLKELIRTTQLEKLQAVQLHGDESPEYCAALNQLIVIKSFGIHDDFDFDALRAYVPFVDYFLFDTKTPTYGGSGTSFNWEKLREYQLDTPFFLSGGLCPESLEDLQEFSHPRFHGIDLNSGFEVAPGIKNIDALKTFIHEFKAALSPA